MRRARLPLADLAPGARALAGEAAHYIGHVLRLAEGDRLVVFDPATRHEASAEVAKVAGALGVLVGPLEPASIVASAPIAIVYALAKGDKVDATIRDATELGATRIVLAETTRAVVKASERIAHKQARWARIALEASRQCGRGDPPTIEGPLPWPDAVALGTAEASYCLDPRAEEQLGTTLPDVVAAGAALAFAIGPEGGLTEEEVERSRRVGYRPVSLGGFVLRTETVTAAVLGAVRVLQSGLDTRRPR